MEDMKKEFDESTLDQTEAEISAGTEIPIEDADEVSDAQTADAADSIAEEAVDGESAEPDGKDSRRSAKLEIELKKSEEKVTELNDRYTRLMAEFDNARKRSDREKSQMYDFGAKDVLEKILPVVDNFERGIEALDDVQKEEPFAAGILKIYQQLMTTLEDVGVKAMNAEGTEFNPDLHNAVMHEDNEEMGENLVAQELQKGYMYKDSVLRHAMVKVVN